MKLRIQNRRTKDISGSSSDVSFLLIIFFMLALVYVTDAGVKLALPEQGDQAKIVAPQEVLEIAMDETTYTLQGKKYTSLTELDAGLNKTLGLDKQNVKGSTSKFTPKAVIITVAGGRQYQDVLSLLELCRKLGLTRYALNMAGASVEQDQVPVYINQDLNLDAAGGK